MHALARVENRSAAVPIAVPAAAAVIARLLAPVRVGGDAPGDQRRNAVARIVEHRARGEALAGAPLAGLATRPAADQPRQLAAAEVEVVARAEIVFEIGALHRREAKPVLHADAVAAGRKMHAHAALDDLGANRGVAGRGQARVLLVPALDRVGDAGEIGLVWREDGRDRRAAAKAGQIGRDRAAGAERREDERRQDTAHSGPPRPSITDAAVRSQPVPQSAGGPSVREASARRQNGISSSIWLPPRPPPLPEEEPRSSGNRLS